MRGPEIDQRTDSQKMNAWIAEHVFLWEYKMSGCDPYEDGECWHNAEGKFPCELPDFFNDSKHILALLQKCMERAKSHFGGSVIMEDTMNGFTMSLISLNTKDSLRCISFYWPTTICLFSEKLFDYKFI